MKVWLLLLLCSLTISYSYGQDIITRTDGKRIEAAVQEISPTQIRYRLFTQPEGPIYIISTSDVVSVEGADGVRRSFSPPTAAPAASAKVGQLHPLGRNLLLLSPFDLFFTNLTLSYEHILPSGKLGIRVPVSIGLRRGEESHWNYRLNKTFSTGLGLNFYPFGQGRMTYYWGPAAQVGFFKQNYSQDFNLPLESRTGTVVEGKVITGGMYHLTKSLFASVEAGLGIRRVSYPSGAYYNPAYNTTNVVVPANVHLGLRF